MNKPKSYSIKEVFDNTLLSFIFEFYCSKETQFIIEDFQKISNKNIIITSDNNKTPTYTSSILLKEYDGKRARYQFKVGYQQYNNIKMFLNTMLFWINENATLDGTTHLKTKLQYNFSELKTLTSISNMDIYKLILKINENFLYDNFPEIKNSPMSLSIKKLMPINTNTNVSHIVNIKNNFKYPLAEYYGVDFTNQTRGELTFNYIGGQKYSEKVNEIYKVLEYYILTTYQVLNTDEYTTTMINEFNLLTEEYRNFRKCYFDYNKFENTYKNFKVYIDLNKDSRIIETYWPKIRDKIMEIILQSKVNECQFNLDTEFGLCQLKNADIKNAVIKNIQIINSSINGIIEECHLWKCEINNSRIIKSSLVVNNIINESYLENVRADRNNEISSSYIVNNGEIINCKVTESIIKNAGIGDRAKLDEKCLIINPKIKEFKQNNAISIKEIRDYKWIKSLRRNDYKDKGFENEYKE